VELNFDLSPERRSFGVYLRGEAPLYGERAGSEAPDGDGYRTRFDVIVNPGMYLTIVEGHQLLLEYGMAFHLQPSEAHAIDLGGVALGYNVVLSERIELVTQAHLHVPQRDEPIAFGGTTGFVATLPSP